MRRAAAALCGVAAAGAVQYPVWMEAENFTKTGCWAAKAWTDDVSMYSATFSNTFMNRQAFLHCPGNTSGAANVATGTLRIDADDSYYFPVRYQAAYRYETRFRLVVKQGSKTVLDHVYGKRSTPRIWPFGWSTARGFAGPSLGPEGHGIGQLATECRFPWGAAESVVWEFAPSPVKLTKGSVTVQLIVDEQGAPPKGARGWHRNVDLVMAYANLTDIQHRMRWEQQLALDGILSQKGEVWIRVDNLGPEINVRVPTSAMHSAYPSQHLICIPLPCGSGHYGGASYLGINAPANSKSAWVEAGVYLDTYRPQTWTFTAKEVGGTCAQCSYAVEFSTDGGKTSFAKLQNTVGHAELEVYADYDVRMSKFIAKPDWELYEIMDRLKAAPAPKGSAPKLTPIYGYTFCKSDSIRDIEPSCYESGSVSAAFDQTLAQFLKQIPITDTQAETPSAPSIKGTKFGYIEMRRYKNNVTELEEQLKGYVTAGVADNVITVSVGDEIALPTVGSWGQDMYTQFCKANKAVGCGQLNTTDTSNAKNYYWSNKFTYDYGSGYWKQRTDLFKKYLPNSRTGANYSPLAYQPDGSVLSSYLYPAYKAISIFRKGGLTLPWGEDYAWQSPIGTQQQVMMMVDQFRAGIKGTEVESRGVLMYVMAHYPGNTPTTWKRLFYGNLAHGTKLIDLYEMRPVGASYTENYVDFQGGTYEMVRDSLYELSNFEDIIQAGTVQSGDTCLWFSEANDAWGHTWEKDTSVTLSIGKKTLYIAARHSGLPVDVVLEGDDLSACRVLYVTDTHVTDAAAAAIAKWVGEGGMLLASAGGGLLNEYNETNKGMAALLGITPGGLYAPESSRVQYEKQDLPYAANLGTVTANLSTSPFAEQGSFGTYGIRADFAAAAGAEVVAEFDDGKPAMSRRPEGKGSAVYCGFLPGLSYFRPALPLVPVDRGTTDRTSAHFCPVDFDAMAQEVVAWPAKLAAAERPAPQPLWLSDNLVDARAVVGAKGTAVPMANWRGAPIAGLVVNVTGAAGKRATLASGGAVKTLVSSGPYLSVTFDLDVADALVLR